MQQQLEAMLHEHSSLTIDAERLEKVDAAGMQLLCSLRKSLLNAEADLYWKNIVPCLKQAAAVLGMKAALGFEKT